MHVFLLATDYCLLSTVYSFMVRSLMGESTAVLLFVCAVAAVYLFAALAVVRMLLRRFGFTEKPTRAESIAERASLVLARPAT